MTECVYFVSAATGERGLIKIGYSSNFANRFGSLQTMSPVPLVALATVDGDRRLELALHRRFAKHRLYGEWFSPHDDILSYIERPYEILQAGERTFSDLIREWGISQFAEDVGLRYFHASTMAARNAVPVDHWSRVIAASELRGEPLTAADLLSIHEASRAQATDLEASA